MRQTAFPGILVRTISIETPPFDEPGVIQEYVGRGLTKEFDALILAADFSEDTVGQFIDEAEETIGPLRDTYKLEYTLLVRATPSIAEGRMLSSIKMNFINRSIPTRARIFTRAKNPFEPDVINVGDPVLDADLSGGEIGDVYEITTTVTK